MENIVAIKKQVEFYFSDANLRLDTFLQTEMKKNEGWIDASILLTFNKLKHLQANTETIRSALEGSTIVDIKQDESKTYLKKIETDEYKKYINDKTVENRILYIKGFDSRITFEEINEYLSKYFEFVLLRMIRNKDKEFTGALFVELKNEEDVEKVLRMQIDVVENEEIIKKRKVEGKEAITNFLLIKKKVDFVTEKKKRKETEKVEDQKKVILSEFKGKFYKYEINKDSDIKTIKALVEGVAFVDKINSVLRYKNIMDYDTKEFEKEDLKIKVSKMNEKEAEEYGKNIKFGSLINKKDKKRSKKRD